MEGILKASQLTDVFETALQIWSPYLRLRLPIFQKVEGSFAQIVIKDHQIQIDLERMQAYGLNGLMREVLAHEIGHHFAYPGNISDHLKALARIRQGLGRHTSEAPLVANLYYDLLINDYLKRDCDLLIDEVYRRIQKTNSGAKSAQSKIWKLYLRIYEILWALAPGELTLDAHLEAALEADARLGAQLVRVYRRDWMDGAGGFALLLAGYFSDSSGESSALRQAAKPLHDTEGAGQGHDQVSDIGPEMIEGEGDEAGRQAPQHPSVDPRLRGESPAGKAPEGNRAEKHPPVPRSIVEFGELLDSAGMNWDRRKAARAYYRALSSKYLIPFPKKSQAKVSEAQLEGVETWDLGASVNTIDWLSSLTASPVPIAGYSLLQRATTEVPGSEVAPVPVNLYVGIDCSGSMGDPAYSLSYPVLAGTIVARSALRAGARVKACLSGEGPGQTIVTPDYTRNEEEVLGLMTDYLGTGYSFGIQHLKPHIIESPMREKVHILIVSDQDLFSILDAKLVVADGKEELLGWEVAESALKTAGGGGTWVLELSSEATYAKQIKKARELGWRVHVVTQMQEVVAFAHAFSRELYLVSK